MTDTDETKLFRIVQAEGGAAICNSHKEGSTVLIPTRNMEENELTFVCNQLNVHWTYHDSFPETVKIFEDKTIYEHIDEYVWELFPKCEVLFMPQTKRKIKKIIKNLCVGVFVVFVVVATLDIKFDWGILSYIEEWLIKPQS